MRAKKDRAFAGCRCTRCGEWFSEVCRCDQCGAPASAMAPGYGPARGLRTWRWLAALVALIAVAWVLDRLTN